MYWSFILEETWNVSLQWDVKQLVTHKDIKKEAQSDGHKYFIVYAHKK